MEGPRLRILCVLSLGLLAVTGVLALPRILRGGSAALHAQGSDSYGTYYVAPGGDCGGMTPCYASVQAAVDAADDPDDVVKVAAGTYTDIHLRDAITPQLSLISPRVSEIYWVK
jgi:hypothetical protein